MSRAQRPAIIAVCLALAVAAIIYMWSKRERMMAIAPSTYLSWDGRSWTILDDAYRVRGVDSLPGGLVVIEDVVTIAIIDAKHGQEVLIGTRVARVAPFMRH